MSEDAFAATVRLAEEVGFVVEARPPVWGSRAALFARSAAPEIRPDK